MNRLGTRIGFSATAFLTLAFLLNLSLEARFRRPDLENIPVKDLIANLKKKVAAEPKDSGLQMNLARVYAMAYAQKNDSLQVNKQKPGEAWFGYSPTHVPFNNIIPAGDKEKAANAKKYLALAITHFESAVSLDKENLTAKLSLAWCLDQAGKKEKAIAAYREVISQGWEKEKGMTVAGLGWHSVVAEAAGYLIPKLGKEKSREEIADLGEKVRQVSTIRRPITPIAFGLKPRMQLADILDRSCTVNFDVDGSGNGKNWSWISSDAAWLVFDQQGDGKIESGLQLFGNVTFWCFWENGYQALGSLDANLDGKLSGSELKKISVWQDANQNGIGDPGEVKSVADSGIVEISCRCEPWKDGRKSGRQPIDAVACSRVGVKFRDGTTRSTYDVVLHHD